MKFGCMSIIINYVYIHCHFKSWLILPGSFVIFGFLSNALLFLLHDIHSFQILFYYKGNEMKNLGSLLLNTLKYDACFETNGIFYFN